MSKDNNISEEFKKEIIENKKPNYLSIALALIAIILIFGTVGAAIYQLATNDKTSETKTSEEKIESQPVEENVQSENTNQSSNNQVNVETPPSAPATPKEETYTVVEGDNLGTIAGKYSTTVEKLMSDNGITDETSLQIGQVLKIIK
jgi:LysM repeat protein